MIDLDLMKPFVTAFVRHALTTAAGALVADGLIMSNQTNNFVGAGLFLVGIAWSWWQKYGQAITVSLLKSEFNRK